MAFRFCLAAVAAALVLAGCGGVTQVHNTSREVTDPKVRIIDNTVYLTQAKRPKNIALFLDGTGNDLNTTTNVARLYQLTVNQNRRDIAAFYTSGVGADRTRVLGLATGLGFKKDVQAAYGFLSDSYDDNRDVIHLYGYSRGAYTARALAGLVHVTGLMDLSVFKKQSDRERFLNALYNASKFPERHSVGPDCQIRVGALQERIDRRRCTTDAVRLKFGVRRKAQHDDVRFAMVGLWDTVETLGISNGQDDPDFANPLYVDQLCNMDKVRHAVSLHDNRSGSYTPVLMTRRWLLRDCETQNENVFKRVREVWFPGDHAQVGGTESRGFLSGLTLNWMLSHARNEGLGGRPIFPRNAQVYEQPLDFVKDAEGQSPFFQIFKRIPRGIRCYSRVGTDLGYRTGSYSSDILIHKSALARQAALTIPAAYRKDPVGKPTVELPRHEDLGQVSKIGDTTLAGEKCAPANVTYVDH